MVLKNTLNAKWLFKSSAAPLYRSLVTSVLITRKYGNNQIKVELLMFHKFLLYAHA